MTATELKVVIYTTPICGYCAAAKRLLANKGVEYLEIDVYMDPAKRAEMTERSRHQTVPQIFIGDTYVGGFDDLNALERKGELDTLLERVLGPAANQGD